MRVIKLIFTLLLLIFWIVLIQKEWGHVKLRMLNHFMPDSYEALIQMNNDPSEVNRKALARYAKYFKIITWVMPEKSDGYELLGVCYFYLGKEIEARHALEKAIKLNPHFFWSQYNLGLLFLKKQQYERGTQNLKAALKISPQETMMQIYNSKIYRDILRQSDLKAEQLIKQLQSGYQLAIISLKISSSDNPVLQSQWQLKVF